MATIINIHEARTHLSRIVEEVAAGKPMARLVPIEANVTKKHLGQLKGKIKIPPDFNKPPPASILRQFDGD